MVIVAAVAIAVSYCFSPVGVRPFGRGGKFLYGMILFRFFTDPGTSTSYVSAGV